MIDTKRTALYSIDAIQRTKLGVSIEETYTSYEVGKRYFSDYEDTVYYKFSIRDVINKSPYISDIRAIENDIKRFQDEISVLVSKEGFIQEILNTPELFAKWSDFKYKLKKKYKKNPFIDDVIKETNKLLQNKKEFTKTFADSDLATLLFPPKIAYLPTNNIIKEVKTITSFFEEIPLLLSITNHIEEKPNKTCLKRIGKLITDEAYNKQIETYFRDLLDNLRIQVSPKVDYIESFDIAPNGWVTHAVLIIHVTIKGVFEFQHIIRLQPKNV